MDEMGQLKAEFETLGEAVVADRLSHNLYNSEVRAVAMRWLNDRSLARIGIDMPIHEAHIDSNLRRMVRNEQITRAAILCAVAALLGSIGSLGLSIQTLQNLQDLRHAVAAAAAQTAAQQSSTKPAPKVALKAPRS